MRKNIIVVVGLGALFVGLYAFYANMGSAPLASPAPPADTGAVNPPPPTPAPTPAGSVQSNESTQSMHYFITLKTTLGDIQFETYEKDAPKTALNFVTLAKRGFYDRVIFHRVIPGFMIQGGDPTGTGMGGPGYKFDDELDPATPSYKAGYKRGVVAMANAGPNTNGSQFFIMLADYPLPNNYTIFGKVTKGQEVVDKIGALPRNAQDRPDNPPAIQGVTVTER